MRNIFNKKILLLAFKFPPYARVGAIRWANMSKHIADMGFKLHIVTVDWGKRIDDSFKDVLENPNIIIHRIPSLSFHRFKHTKKTNKGFINLVFNKFQRLFLFGLSFLYFVDEAQFWGLVLLPYCKKLIKKENISTVIATGSPFMVPYWASKLREKVTIQLIQDIRDPWNDDEEDFKKAFVYKFNYFRKKSNRFENFALNNCDAMVSVTQGLTEILQKRIYNKEVIVRTIYNGFDFNRIKNTVSIIKKNFTRDFTFIYAGSLVCRRDIPLESFLNVVEKNLDKFPEIQINLFGYGFDKTMKKYPALVANKALILHNPVSYDKILKEMYKNFVCIQLNADVYPYALSTKIYEYAVLARPTLSLNYGGEIDLLMSKFNMGYSVNANDEKMILETIIDLYKQWKLDPDYQIGTTDISNFDYYNLSTQYIDIICELQINKG